MVSGPSRTFDRVGLDSVADGFMAADVALDRARRDLRRLDDVTFVLPDLEGARRRADEVQHFYANWLVWARMVGVAIDSAGRAAGRPDGFKRWWASVGDDPAHAFFKASRNEALKEVADLVAEAPLRLDTGETRVFFAFDGSPFDGQPLVARCQQYTEWLYDVCLAPAREQLWDYGRGCFLDGSQLGPRRVFWPARNLV